mmetsp:Transcript_16742/g.23642  ORF Transcript_16742/g.23642 Transcript_16742/m.23642 type:complete len:719 (-) Transcript_16742:80-2236(-)
MKHVFVSVIFLCMPTAWVIAFIPLRSPHNNNHKNLVGKLYAINNNEKKKPRRQPYSLSLSASSPSSTSSSSMDKQKSSKSSSKKDEDSTLPENNKSNIDTVSSTTSPNEASVAAINLAQAADLNSTPKSKKLKDKMWIRETLEDLTAAEFACSIGSASSSTATTKVSSSAPAVVVKKKKIKRAVDYENILSKLDKCIREMNCDIDFMEDCEIMNIDDEEDKKLFPSPHGAGSLTYTPEQRKALLMRILAARRAVMDIMETLIETNESKNGDGTLFDNIELPEIRVDIPKKETNSKKDAKQQQQDLSSSKEIEGTTTDLYVREDGTIDWDGALQDRAALKKFGKSVWARINGQDPDLIDDDDDDGDSAVSEVNHNNHGQQKAVTAKIEETEAIRKEYTELEALLEEYNDMQKAHTALLNSAISAGQAAATINLATLDPSLRNKIRRSAESLEKKKEEVSFQTLMYELERIYTYLDGEMALKGYVPLQDRLNVAEFGLLESQIASLNTQLEAGDIVDADVLEVVLAQLNDFKRRLGIDYYVAGLTYDREAIQRWLSELLEQTKTGISFYVKGCQLFWNDIVFAFSLVARALTGYTLKPREVRNLRRTFKDVITFIPVVIILIIPLSPVGHVLVFGAIQRFFPDFFPSCFTEQRQNLLQLYESTEYSEVTINETLEEKVYRVGEAFAYVVANSAKDSYKKLTGLAAMPEEDDSLNGGTPKK